jgi:Ca-activated chloride channel family protein
MLCVWGMVPRPLVVAVLLLAASAVGAQTLPPPEGTPPVADPHVTFRSGVDLVTLNVTVTDDHDRQVPGLAQQDFQVVEDGVPQKVTFFAASEVPLDVAVLIDTSASMREKLALVQLAASRFLKTFRPGDRAELVGFNSQTRVLAPFSADVTRVEAAVKQTVARGATALYTAVYVTLDQFMHARTEDGALRRPAIVLLTDGDDTASLIQFDDVLERARRAGVAIYTISILSPGETQDAQENAGGRRFLTESEYALKTLAKETGGRAFFPLRLSDLDGVYGTVATELSTQYAIGYVPAASRTDGAFHRVLVRVLSRPDARSRTRTGYYSPRMAASLVPRPDR